MVGIPELTVAGAVTVICGGAKEAEQYGIADGMHCVMDCRGAGKVSAAGNPVCEKQLMGNPVELGIETGAGGAGWCCARIFWLPLSNELANASSWSSSAWACNSFCSC